MQPVKGIQTEFYTDVKLPVIAGMQFRTNNYKLRKVGYDVYRHYFDTAEKDCQVDSQRIKRVIKS